MLIASAERGGNDQILIPGGHLARENIEKRIMFC
jgi:hypothetical protein